MLKKQKPLEGGFNEPLGYTQTSWKPDFSGGTIAPLNGFAHTTVYILSADIAIIATFYP